MAYTLASQTLRLQGSTEPTGIKHPAPVLPLVGWTHRSPFTIPHPAVHSLHTITGPIGVGSRPRMRRQDSPPLTRDRDRPLTLTSPLFFCGETTSHCRCRLLRNAKRPPKRILPCASHPAFSAALLGLRGRAICPAVCTSQGSLGGSAAKNRLQRRRRRSCRINPWVGKIPWRRAQQPTPLFLPGESHGQRSLAGHSP